MLDLIYSSKGANEMAMENKFCIITKDEQKMSRIEKALQADRQPDGLCMYEINNTEYSDYYTISGLLRNNVIDELIEYLNIAGIDIAENEFVFINYESEVKVYRFYDEELIEVATKRNGKTEVSLYGSRLPYEVKSLVLNNL